MIMHYLKMSDERYKKYLALKNIGITVETVGRKLVISVVNFPDADKYIDTAYNNVDEILYAFRDDLYKQNIKLLAA